MRFYLIAALVFLAASSVQAGPLRAMLEQRRAQNSAEPVVPDNVLKQSFEGRALLVYLPTTMPAKGSRALVVVLHGGMGSAERIESGVGNESPMSLDPMADKYGFIVAYLNGTPVARREGHNVWNAGGGCCGQAYRNNVDDVGYITKAVSFLAQKYGVNLERVYGVGHSNGAMMTQRLMCETQLYAAAVAISGPLMVKNSGSCAEAAGKHILAIHGDEDDNVPIAGGKGQGIADVVFNSEKSTQTVYANSHANYQLDIVQGASHKVTSIDDALMKTSRVSLAQKIVAFFALNK